MKKGRFWILILTAIAIASSCALCTIAASAADESLAPGSLGEIDVYLIAGQSNAVGYGSDGLSVSIMNDPRYTNGFDNVLYYGNAEGNLRSDFVPVTVGLGKDSNRVGAEVGIAAAVGDGDRMSAVIKHAIGGSYLYPTTDGTPAFTYGTWTPPDYIEKYGVNTENNKIGDIYEEFLNTVESGITELIEQGYTPVIRGIWWMQGEAETPYEVASMAYKELLKTLILQMREDVGAIVGNDLSSLPFVMGKIKRNPEHQEQPAYVYMVNEAQVAVTEEVEKTFIVDTSALPQIDGWHFTADAQHWIGREFISTILSAAGKYSVTVQGLNVTMSGGGEKKAGESVTVSFTPYENCTLESVKIKIGSEDATVIELDEANSYTFTMPSESVIFEAYATDPGAINTPYGIIPSAYADAEQYAFALFKDGVMIHAFEDWHTFVNGNSLTGCTLLMRRSYSTTEGADAWGMRNIGELTIDLGGFVLTRGDYHLFQALGKNSTANSTVFRIINGTLKTTSKKTDGTSSHPLIVFNNEESSTVSDSFEFIFDGVTFDVSSGRGILTCYGGGTVGSKGRIILNNCVIDRGSSTSSLPLFSMADSAGNKNDIEVIINGGHLTATTLTGLTFATFNAEREEGKGSPDSFTFGKDTSGYEFVVELPSGYTVGETAHFALEDGNYYPILKAADTANAKTSYTLVNLTTPYGDINPTYISVTDYPFALFKNNKMIHAFKDWNNFINSEVYKTSNYKTGCTLLLRRDYSTSEASGNIWALSYINDMLIDLGGHTLTRGNNHLFHAISHGSADNYITIEVINGTLKANFYKDGTTNATAPLIVFNNDLNSTSTDRFEFIFNGITFDVSEGRGIIASYNDGKSTAKNESRVVLNNCTILRGNKTNSMVLFALDDTSLLSDIEVVVSGGMLTAASTLSINNLKFVTYSGQGTADKISVNNDFKVVLPINQAAPTVSYSFTSGEYFLMKQPVAAGDETAEYVFCDIGTLTTDYGNISVEYASVEDYPFVLFKNGSSIYGFKDWESFIDSAVTGNADYQSGCTILLRRDYSTSEAQKNNWALSYIRDMAIDLGGHTLTRGNTHLFNAISNGNVNTVTVITIFNGTIRGNFYKDDGKTSTGAIICFNNDSKSTSTDTFIFNLNGITFDVSTGRGIVACFNDGTEKGITKATLNLNDCIITRGEKTNIMTLFALDDTSDRCDIEVVINGGMLDANSLANLTFAKYSEVNGRDNLSFGRGDNGKYLTISVDKGSPITALNGIFTTADGIECIFMKTSEDDSEAFYTLYPDAMLGFKIKSSVSLWSNLVYNVYIPTANVKSFTVNGGEMEYTTLTVDGVEYYLVAVSLAAGDSLSDIEVRVTLNAGATDVTAKWTLSILSYVNRALGDGCDAVTEALMKDMLSYARAAHIFFGRTEGIEDKLSAINNILGADHDTDNKVAIPEGAAKKPADDSYFTYITASLGEIPSFRFYLADGYGKEDFSFKVGGASVVATEGSDSKYGRYLEIVVYAYRMCDDVTYTVKASGVTETYNLYAYYEWAKTLGNDNLTLIVERLMKYSESADRYRDAVIGGEA